MAWGQEKVEAPIWNVGDKWTYKRADGVTFTNEIVDVKEELFILKASGIRDLYGYDKRTMNVKFIIEESGKQVKSISTIRNLFNFPIFVGKKWTDTTTEIPARGQREVTYVSDFKTEGIEEITTPAGTFKAYKIHYKQMNMGAMNNGWARFWYSPDAKTWIKRELEKSSFWVGVSWAQDAQLISYDLK
jgi:hypothetical protein